MTSYLFLAPGFEEIEAVATVDVLRRADIDVRTVAVTTDGSEAVEGAHGVPVVADFHIDQLDLNGADWLICPGGLPGAQNLHECSKLNLALIAHNDRGGHIAAICASPALVLAPLGILDGRQATCYPGFEEQCPKAKMTGAAVEVAGNVITGNGPASTVKFALAIVAEAAGQSVADQVAAGMLVK